MDNANYYQVLEDTVTILDPNGVPAPAVSDIQKQREEVEKIVNFIRRGYVLTLKLENGDFHYFCKRKPKTSCPRCFGRGYQGYDVNKKNYVLCTCSKPLMQITDEKVLEELKKTGLTNL